LQAIVRCENKQYTDTNTVTRRCNKMSYTEVYRETFKFSSSGRGTRMFCQLSMFICFTFCNNQTTN